MLTVSGRLRLRMDVARWIDEALARPKIQLLQFSPASAVRAAGLGGTLPGDPADRFIIAAALELRAALVTKDRRIIDWGGVETIW